MAVAFVNTQKDIPLASSLFRSTIGGDSKKVKTVCAFPYLIAIGHQVGDSLVKGRAEIPLADVGRFVLTLSQVI